MKTLFFGLAMLCAARIFASTNTLVLTWTQPPGYVSTLYASTNLTGTWTPLGVVTPPITTLPTNPVTFFYVAVAPTNQLNGGELYVSDPNTELVTPRFPSKPDYAYAEGGLSPVYYWNTSTHIWE